MLVCMFYVNRPISMSWNRLCDIRKSLKAATGECSCHDNLLKLKHRNDEGSWFKGLECGRLSIYENTTVSRVEQGTIQWPAVLWGKMPWWFQISTNKICSSLEYCRRVSLDAQHTEPWNRWATAVGDHSGELSLQFTQASKLDNRRVEKYCLVWWASATASTSRW